MHLKCKLFVRNWFLISNKEKSLHNKLFSCSSLEGGLATFSRALPGFLIMQMTRWGSGKSAVGREVWAVVFIRFPSETPGCLLSDKHSFEDNALVSILISKNMPEGQDVT